MESLFLRHPAACPWAGPRQARASGQAAPNVSDLAAVQPDVAQQVVGHCAEPLQVAAPGAASVWRATSADRGERVQIDGFDNRFWSGRC